MLYYQLLNLELREGMAGQAYDCLSFFYKLLGFSKSIKGFKVKGRCLVCNRDCSKLEWIAFSTKIISN